MTSPRNRRTPRQQRRNLNSEEMYALGFVEMQARADNDGWPYADDDDFETTENWTDRHGNHHSSSRGDGPLTALDT